MSKAPLPETLPGRFFVLEYRRDGSLIDSRRGLPLDKRDVSAAGSRFILHVDDASKSTYNLGHDIEVVMMRFRVWLKSYGFWDLGNRAIDIAKEFGAAQVIPSQNRAIAVFDRNPKKNRLQFTEETNYGSALPSF